MSVARALADEAIPIDVVVSSPLVRAVQTAAIVADTIAFVGDRPATYELRPEGDPRSAVTEVESLGAIILAVSHEPLVSSISATLGVPRNFLTGEIRGFDGGKMVFHQLP